MVFEHTEHFRIWNFTGGEFTNVPIIYSLDRGLIEDQVGIKYTLIL